MKTIKKPQCPSAELTAETVKHQLANTRQITFEVTDSCNLRCMYCGLGDMYDTHDQRENRFLDFKKAITLIDYVMQWIKSSFNTSLKEVLSIGFYGGEPLLNMSVVKKIVDYVKKNHTENRDIQFNMTTNALLLYKYIDFLVEHGVHLLISLDGNKENHSYRILPNGNNSFEKVVRNVNLIKQQYPDYFEKYVNFNAVLHNRNSVTEIYDFIYPMFNKKPNISSLTTTGVRPELKQKFWDMFRNINDSFIQTEEYIAKELFVRNPNTKDILYFIHHHSNNVYRDFEDLLFEKQGNRYFPTGTCAPFSKKVFLTVNGKILPCERINHEYALGTVSDDGVHLDFNRIASKYNDHFGHLKKQCKACYNSRSCIQCIFFLNDLKHPHCNGFMNKDAFLEYKQKSIDYLRNNPDLYKKIMQEVTLD